MNEPRTIFERMSEIARRSKAAEIASFVGSGDDKPRGLAPFSPDRPKGPDPDAIAAELTPEEAATMLQARPDFSAAELDAPFAVVASLQEKGLVRPVPAWFVGSATPLGSRVVRSLQRRKEGLP